MDCVKTRVVTPCKITTKTTSRTSLFVPDPKPSSQQWALMPSVIEGGSLRMRLVSYCGVIVHSAVGRSQNIVFQPVLPDKK